MAGLFFASILFWMTVGFYCILGYLSAGGEGVKDWLLHVAVRPVITEAAPATSDWNAVALRFVGIALITLVLGLANRKVLRRLAVKLREYFVL